MAKTGGHPDYTRAGSRFIPEIWAGKVLVPLHQRILASNPRLNTDYEGEILKIGDTVLFREDYNFRPWGTFHKDTRLHALTINKGVYVSCFVPDAMDAQADLNLLDRYCKEITNQAFTEMEIPKGPALFAVQVLEAEMVRYETAFQDKIRMLVGYGYKSLDPFRVATEIIGRASLQGKDVKEILVELGKEGF
jgi:hypothetical protein